MTYLAYHLAGRALAIALTLSTVGYCLLMVWAVMSDERQRARSRALRMRVRRYTRG